MSPYPHRVSILVLLTLAGAASGGAVPVNQWLGASSGNWTNAARWSLGAAPGIPGESDEDALIDASGAAYTVTLAANAILRDFSLLSSDATLTIAAGGDLTVGGFGRIGDANDPLTGGTLLLHGGTLRGGEWLVGPGGEFRVRGAQGNRLINTTVHGDVLVEAGGVLTLENASADRFRMLGNSSMLRFEHDAIISHSVLFEGAGNALRMIVSNTEGALFHITSDATVETTNDFGGRALIGSVGSLDANILNDGLIAARSGSVTLGASAITNNGMMDLSGGAVTTLSNQFINTGTIGVNASVLHVVAADPKTGTGLTNSGSVTASDATLNLASGLTNTGTISVERSTVSIDAQRFTSTGAFTMLDSTLRVGGNFVLEDLSGVSRTGSTIAIAGALLNDGNTLDLGALSDRLALDGGSIRGGTVLASDAAPLRILSNNQNALDGVAFSGRLLLDDDASFLRVRTGSTIEGVIEMSGGTPELRFEGDAFIDDTHILFQTQSQAFIAADNPGQTLVIGPNTVLQGRGLTNSPWSDSAPGAQFQKIVNYGEWIVEGPLYWQLHSASDLINFGLISIGSGAELVAPVGFDLADGSVRISEGGRLTIFNAFHTPVLMPSFFAGDMVNEGVIALDATVDLQGETVVLREAFGDTRVGSDYGFLPRSALRNGTMIIENGASLLFDVGAIAASDLVVHGGFSIGPDAHVTMTRVTSNMLTVRGGVTTMTDCAFSSSRLEHGEIIANDLADLGTAHIVGDTQLLLRMSYASGGNTGRGEFIFDPLSALSVETTAGQHLTNRVDWDLADSARVILRADRVINEANVRLTSNAELRINGPQFQNVGELRMTNDSHIVVRGDLELANDSSFRFDIANFATRRGLSVEGEARLGGAFEVTVTTDTALAPGRSWAVISAASATGAFTSVVLDEIEDPTLRFMLRETVTSSSFTLHLLVRHFADPNGDRVVDMRDLNLVLEDFGRTGSLLAGDADTNGIVDFDDLNLVLANFGRTFRSTAVPTPGAFAAFCVIACGGPLRRRR